MKGESDDEGQGEGGDERMRGKVRMRVWGKVRVRVSVDGDGTVRMRSMASQIKTHKLTLKSKEQMLESQ